MYTCSALKQHLCTHNVAVWAGLEFSRVWGRQYGLPRCPVLQHCAALQQTFCAKSMHDQHGLAASRRSDQRCTGSYTTWRPASLGRSLCCSNSWRCRNVVDRRHEGLQHSKCTPVEVLLQLQHLLPHIEDLSRAQPQHLQHGSIKQHTAGSVGWAEADTALPWQVHKQAPLALCVAKRPQRSTALRALPQAWPPNLPVA